MTSEYETGTKIVATLGPASWDEPTLSELLRAGVDCARINGSHTDHDGIRKQVARVRRAAAKVGQPCSILLDLQGPKIRIGKVDGVLDVPTGEVLTVVMDDSLLGSGRTVGTTYPQMADDVSAGDRVLFADGALQGVVDSVHREKRPAEVLIRMTFGGQLTSNKGLNLPDVEMSVPCLTEKDKGDLAVGLESGVDYVALSFVRKGADLHELLEHMDRHGRAVPRIAKIEKPQAVTHLDDILDHCEGVMVARGDLGVEVDIEKVPVFQKHIIDSAFKRGKLVITATQMLDSMERNPRPTRAETTDVANAILDGTDAVMLSGETSIGQHPVAAVRTMDRISRQVEASRFFRPTPPEDMPALDGLNGAIIRAATYTSAREQLPLVVFTWSGTGALLASRARLRQPLFALTPEPAVVDRLQLVWGVSPMLVPPVRTTEELLQSGEQVLLERGLLKRGDAYVVLAGRSPSRGTMNLMKVVRVGERE